jgi:tetratricopeptide (TPR) repeat protein
VSDNRQTALVHPGSAAPFRLADSLESASVGEVMAIDENGQVVGPRSARLAMVKYWGLMAVLGGLGGSVVVMAGAPVVLGGMVFASALGLFAWELRRSPAIKRAVALAAAGQREDAWQAFSELDQKHHPSPTRATIDYWMGNLAWQRGDLEMAQTRYERAALIAKQSRHMKVTLWIVEFARAQLFAVRGDVEKARLLRGQLSDAPTGDYLRMAGILTDLAIAFHGDNPDELPDDAELYEWAKQILSMSRFGQGAVLLAWAFSKRGDDDMATMMLSEAPERLQGSFPAETDPKLHAWAIERAGEWKLDGPAWA